MPTSRATRRALTAIPLSRGGEGTAVEDALEGIVNVPEVAHRPGVLGHPWTAGPPEGLLVETDSEVGGELVNEGCQENRKAGLIAIGCVDFQDRTVQIEWIYKLRGQSGHLRQQFV